MHRHILFHICFLFLTWSDVVLAFGHNAPPSNFYITLLLRPQVFLIDSVANNEKHMKYTDAHVLLH